MKKVLIYEPMPDIVRAEHICAIAQRELEKGHQVLLILEEEVQLLYRNSLNKPHSVYCKNVIRAKIADSGIPFFALPQNRKLKERFKTAPEETLEDINNYRIKNFKGILLEFCPDLIIVWNGLAHYQQDFLSLSKNLNPDQNYQFLEAGWFPQRGTYYEDPSGVNAKSSIAKNTPPSISEDENALIEQWKSEFRKKNGNYAIKDRNFIFLPLQVETDTNITLFSPFKKMADFVRWADENTPKDYQIVVRPHPLSSPESSGQLGDMPNRVLIDTQSNLYQLIAECTAVLGINSTTLLESLIFDKPVFSMGKGIFQSSPAIQKQDPQKSFELIKKTDNSRSRNALLYHLLKLQRKIPPLSPQQPNQLLNSCTRPTNYSKIGISFSKLLLQIKCRIIG